MPQATKRLREPVAEIEIGDEVVAAPEALAREVLLERGERARRIVQLDQRRRPRVIR
jgi:hypothetical protein